MRRALPFLFLLCAAGAQAELYKWVGPDGKVTYSDVPPPKADGQLQKKSIAGGASAGADLPFELAQAVKNNPATLYTTGKCLPCDDARMLLKNRGIPFTEKTVSSNDDMIKLRETGGAGQLPLLMLGRSKQQGFEAGEWNTALTAAGYPVTSKLPRNYQSPPPESAAPAPAPQATAEKQPVPAKSEARPRPAAPAPAPKDDALPGFRF